jgi:hypothetical protein
MRRLLAFGLGVLGFFTVSSCEAANLPQKAFQVLYEETGTVGGKATRMYAWDGKGHGRSETVRASGRKDVAVIDGPNKTMTMYMGDSAPITIPMKDGELDAMAALGEKFKSGGTPLGTKVIDGHPCVGTKYLLAGTEEEIWKGQDIGVRVYSKVKTSYGITESHLKSYTNAPSPALFTGGAK